MTQYLQDTVEAIGIDLVNPGICHFVWKACDDVVFEHIRSSDFIAFINLHKKAPIPIDGPGRCAMFCMSFHYAIQSQDLRINGLNTC